MPSTSKAQQRFMGLVHAYIKGEDKKRFEKARKANGEQLGYKLSGTSDVKEDRDYKEEYKKYGSSTKSKKYRAELNQYNRKKGTYGNGDGKDASHKGGKIVGFEKESTNRGRAEKSRLKKEASAAYGKSIEKIANDRKLKSISKKDRAMLLKIAKLMKKANESVNERKLSSHQKKAILIAIEMSGNMTGATKKIEKIKKGLSNDKKVKDALQLANESVNEARSTNREWNTFEKDYGDFFKTVVKLGKANTKLTGDKTDEKIFLTNFTRNVGKFYTLMKSWKRGQNESVNESIQLPHGMELGKVFTGHGKSFVKEAVEPAGNMRKIQHIVKSKTAMKVGGTIIDMQSANLLMKLFNAVSDKDKEKMNTFPAKKLTLVIKNLWSRVKLKLPI